MAERRMFAKTIIDSDAFLDMPASAQCLYFHLSMRADDEGFVNSPRKIQRMVGASEDDARLLIAKNFIIPFESGVVVIKHWRIHNYIQNDRFKPTAYREERERLTVKSNGAYTLDAECIQDGYNSDTQDSIGKVSIGKVSIGKDNNGADRASVDDAIADFVKHRKALKRPLTEKGIELIRLELERLAPHDPDTQIAIINQSIQRGWQGVFPLKNDAPKTETKSGPPMKTQYDKTYAEPIDDDLDRLAKMLGVEE